MVSPDAWSEVAAPLLAAQEGVMTSAQLRRRGVSADLLRSWVAGGRVARLRRNVLVDGEVWRSAPSWDRHLIRARGVMLDREQAGGEAAPARVALSHHSALAVMGLSIHGVDDLVHLVAVGPAKSRRRGDVVRHAGVGGERVSDAFGLPVVTPAVACVQVAAAFGVEAGLVAADSALRSQLCTREELEDLRGWSWLGRGRPAAEVVISRADRRHESAGESRCAWLLHRSGYSAVPQAVILDEEGGFVARADFLLERDGVIVEFDGMLKYETRQDLVLEKRREDRLRALGYEVVRLTWADLARPDLVVAKVQAGIRRASARRRVG